MKCLKGILLKRLQLQELLTIRSRADFNMSKNSTTSNKHLENAAVVGIATQDARI